MHATKQMMPCRGIPESARKELKAPTLASRTGTGTRNYKVDIKQLLMCGNWSERRAEQ